MTNLVLTMTRLRRVPVVLIVPVLLAADWPQFLGAARDGSSPEVVKPFDGKPEELWRKPVGDAHSSPVVAGGVVYAFYQPGKEPADALAAFDAKTGEKKWEKTYPRAEFKSDFGTGPRGTPAVSGGKVFTFGSTGVLTAWSAADGAVVWRVDTLKQFKAKNLYFGVSASPTVAAGKVIVPVGGKGAGLVAFAADTGKVVWQATDDKASYASPVVTGTGDAARVLTLSGSHLRSLTLDGKPDWAVPFVDALSESSTTPVVAGGAVIGSSVTAGSIAVRPGEAGTTPETVWQKGDLSCYFSTPVPVGGQLYMVTGSILSKSVVLRCVDAATGKVLWSKPDIGRYHAALVRTGDSKLLMLDDAGRLTLIQPDAAEYKQLSQAKVCGPTWAHPALADGVVYVRDDKHLIAVRVK